MIERAMIELLILLMNDGMEKLEHTPTMEVFHLLVLDIHSIPISQVPTHAQLDLGQMIEEAKYVHQKFALTTIP